MLAKCFRVRGMCTYKHSSLCPRVPRYEATVEMSIDKAAFQYLHFCYTYLLSKDIDLSNVLGWLLLAVKVRF